MDEIPISKFKATCAAVVDEVARTGRSVTITRRGKPIAEVSPVKPARSRAEQLGCMAGEIEIIGDIVSSPWTKEELDEIEAEWLANWDVIEAKGQAIAAKNRRAAKSRATARKLR